MSTKTAGDEAEQWALEHLLEQDLLLVDRNFRCRVGEIDLIMVDGATLVFVEVRRRSSNRYGTGADPVTRTKQRRIIHTAEYYLTRHRELRDRLCRFDVVSVRSCGETRILDWIPGAFT